MDRDDKVLDYFNMSSIPTYALYGEQQTSAEHWLHWETITSRSRLYGFRIAAHRHEELYQLLYVSRGRASVMLDGETFELSPPAVIVVPPLAVHGFSFSPDIEGLVLTFFARDVRNVMAEIGPETVSLMRPGVLRPVEGVVDPLHLDRLVTLLIAEADHAAPGQNAALKARLTLLLVALLRIDLAALRNAREETDVSARHARAFVALVDQHYRDTRKIGFYASRLGITPTHLNRVCRQIFGSSALSVIERRIVLEARRYLQFSVLSIKEIGILLGYPDPAYFSRFFAQRVGQSPQAIRNAISSR
ncbi:helix-turn-helix domain-containing protein [Pelagibacterium limicola]|uniref:helix-turn-helix domain-containing protein n=1 Tax=Pelagibacterium limicola TaxID=2791022 RepID=UPI001FE97F1C|nr:helix-turn-helix domain-containing protein [Pelagibacterium limicola]